jgi:hypothetical protein
MADLISRITYESKIAPGAVVTFRRPTAASRAVFLQAQAATLAKVREIQRQRKPLDDEHRKALKAHEAELLTRVDAMIEAEGITRQDAESRVEMDRLRFHFEFRADHPEWGDSIDLQGIIEHDGIGWARLRQMVVGVEGLSVDGEPVTTADGIIERCHPSLADELIKEAERIAGLSATERGELLPPGTSLPLADGASPSTTATPAESAPAAA